MPGTDHPGFDPSALVPAAASDRLHDLDFAAYRPQRPLAGKARAESLLWAALAAAGQRGRWEPPLRAIQRALGPGRTIWGAVSRDGRPSWQLRLANPGREPLLDLLRRLLAPSIALAPAVPDLGDYDILQIALDSATTGPIDDICFHRRGPQPGEAQIFSPASGQPIGKILVVEAKRQIAAALARIRANKDLDLAADRRLLGKVLIPELFACRHLHVVERPGAAALIFSGINIDQLAWFLPRFGYPRPLCDLVTGARARFEHLLFDVGITYHRSGAAITCSETAFYGVL